MSRSPALLTLAAVLGTSGCAAPQRLAFTPGELRAELGRRAPGLAAPDVVVPFELGPEERARALAIVGRLESIDEKVKALVQAMFDPRQLGLRYADRVTGDAAETLRAGEGNCLALASVFVGFARAVGLEAYYMDASARVHETTHAEDGMTVTAGHVTALVVTPKGNLGLDFARVGPFVWYRTLDDVEAVAHFYNNRAFERIEEARERDAPVDWNAAALDFRRATEVKPAFARAWSNLGMAEAALGREDDAVAHYREAIRRDPALVAPRNNLGSLLLRRGDVHGALGVLEGAVAIASAGPHVHYNLALARLRGGDREGAVRSLRLASSKGYPRAERLLAELAVASLPEDAARPVSRGPLRWPVTRLPGQ